MPFLFGCNELLIGRLSGQFSSSDHIVIGNVLVFQMTLTQTFAHLGTAQVIPALLYCHLLSPYYQTLSPATEAICPQHKFKRKYKIRCVQDELKMRTTEQWWPFRIPS